MVQYPEIHSCNIDWEALLLTNFYIECMAATNNFSSSINLETVFSIIPT